MDAALDSILPRYFAICPSLREHWIAEADDGSAPTIYTFFILLTRELQRLLKSGDRSALPALFAEVERSMESDEFHEYNAAATCFLENISNGFPSAYARILPLLGETSISFLQQWEGGDSDTTSFLSAEQAHALVVGPLSEACPAFAGAWRRSAPGVSSQDGLTTSFGLASVTFDFVAAAIERGEVAQAEAVLRAVDRLLDIERRSLDKAFRISFLDRFTELPLDRLAAVPELLGAGARAYWKQALRFGELHFEALRDSHLVDTRELARDDEWGAPIEFPIAEVGTEVREIVRFGQATVADRTYVVSENGYSFWGWAEDDPPGDYSLEILHRGRSLGRIAFALRDPADRSTQ